MVYGHVLWLLLATSLQALAENQSLPPSPCPEIFQYQVDPGGIWYGLINVPTPEPDYNVKLKVELGLDAILPNQYAGKIQLVEHKYEVWRRLVTRDKRPVQYRVFFPVSSPLPVVKYIASNQNVLCSGNPQPTITKLSLEHMLYPVRLNSVPENINNPVTQDSDKANLNLQPQDVKVYYQHFPPPQSGSTQGTNNGNINLQDQNVKIYYHQYSPPESILSQPQYQSSVPYQAVAQNQPATPMQYQSGVPQQNQPIVPLQPPTQYQSGVPQQNQPIVSLQPPSQYQSGVPQQNQPIAPKPPTQYQPSIPPEQNQSTFPRQPPMQYQPTLTPQQNLPFQTIMPRQPQNQPETQSVNFPNLQTQKEKPPQPGGFQVFIPSIQPAPTAEPVKPVQTVPARTKSPPHLTPPPRTKRPSTTTTTTSTTTVAPENVLEDECGISTTEAVPLVINGLPTARGEWPWLVAMFVKSKSVGLQFQCGGSLLSKTVVLTAAHCVKYRDRPEVQAESIVLYMGKFNLQQWTETNSQARDVEKVHIHPDYKSNDRKSEADLAIMILKDAVEYTIYVKPICLWIFSSDINQIVGQTGTVVGWGKDETGSSSAEPHKVSMPIVSHGDCVLSNKEFFYYVTNRTFCAGMRDGTGPCSGDSGGGFMIGYEEGDVLRWYLRGVVHLSLYDRQNQQCDLQSYLIYTDVAVFMDWIREFVP